MRSQLLAYLFSMNDICGIVPVMVNTYSLDQGVMMPLLDNVFNVKTDVYSEAMMLRKSSNGQPQYFKLFYTHPHPDVPCNTTIYNIWSADFCGELLVFLLDKTHSAFVDIDKLGDVDHDIGSIVADFLQNEVPECFYEQTVSPAEGAAHMTQVFSTRNISAFLFSGTPTPSIVPVSAHHYNIDNGATYPLTQHYFIGRQVNSAHIIVHNGLKFVRYRIFYTLYNESTASNETVRRQVGQNFYGDILVFRCAYLSDTLKGVNGLEHRTVVKAVKRFLLALEKSAMTD